MARKNTSPLDIFWAEVQSLPEDVPTKRVWNSFRYVMNDFVNTVKNLETLVMGDGNGNDGLLQRLKNQEDALKGVSGKLDLLIKTIEDDKRVDKFPERKYIIDKILPGLIQMLITAIVGGLFALWLKGQIP